MERIRKYGLPCLLALIIMAGSLKYMSHLVTVSNNVNGRELPIHSVAIDEPKVALTFDVAWSDDGIPQILEVLAQHNLRVTFFVTGDWVEKYPDIVKEIQAAGHDLGNHSANHRSMTQMAKGEQEQQILETHKKVKEITGIEMNLFRPPYGDYNDELILTAEAAGYFVVKWDVDSLDWKDYGAESIISTVINHETLQKGSIILCHSGTKYTVEALEGMIEGLQGKGYEVVPVSALIYSEDYHMDIKGRQVKD